MKIEVWLDFICPYCYIGTRQLELSLDNFSFRQQVFIQFKSYQQMNHKLSNESYEHLYKQAADVGLTLQKNLQSLSTFDAHRLVKYANRLNKGTKLTGRLLTAYFVETKNIADPTVLGDLAEDIGLCRTEVEKVLETRKFTNAVHEDIDLANEIDVQATPFFVFNEKYALSGIQPSHVFQEVLETVWQENDAHHERRYNAGPKKTSYCDGDGHCEKDDKIE